MTTRQLEILQHSLGVDEYGEGRMYRNHFCAGGDDEQTCRELIALGYMVQHKTTEMYPYFNCSVTETGKRAMIEASPKMSPGKRRYREWLRCADCFPDWTFGDYLKNRKRLMEAIRD